MRVGSALIVLVCAVLGSSQAFAQACPEAMQSARRLVLVTVSDLSSSTATMRLYERAQPGADWRRVGGVERVNVGSRGVAWGRAFRALAAAGEPVKTEGDKRTPAGIYAIGRPFGFGPSPLANYLRLQPDNVCVEDPASPAYNTIATAEAVHHANSRDNMGVMPRYRRGLIVEYPTDAASRAGSCIFIHIWKGPSLGTSGCVTMPERRVAALQKFASEQPTVLALLPEAALRKLDDCLSLTATTAEAH